jgi:hypothetical protein
MNDKVPQTTTHTDRQARPLSNLQRVAATEAPADMKLTPIQQMAGRYAGSPHRAGAGASLEQRQRQQIAAANNRTLDPDKPSTWPPGSRPTRN